MNNRNTTTSTENSTRLIYRINFGNGFVSRVFTNLKEARLELEAQDMYANYSHIEYLVASGEWASYHMHPYVGR